MVIYTFKEQPSHGCIQRIKKKNDATAARRNNMQDQKWEKENFQVQHVK